MKRSLLALALATLFVAAPAQAKLVEIAASPNPASLGDHVRHTVSIGGPSRIEQVRAVRSATLAMSGGASPPWMREAIQKLASAIPGARYRVLEGQTHAVDPRALARAVEELLAGTNVEDASPR